MTPVKNKAKLSVPSIVLGIVGTSFSVILPIVSYACCIPGLIIAIKDRKKAYRTKPGFVLNVVGLSIAFINSVFAVVIATKVWLSDKKK